MADYKHQPLHQAGLQHLAHLQQDSGHQQQALAVVQALERERLDLRQQHNQHQAALTQAALEAYLQQQLQEKK